MNKDGGGFKEFTYTSVLVLAWIKHSAVTQQKVSAGLLEMPVN